MADVKLTRREPRNEVIEAGIWSKGQYGSASYQRNAWQAMHDAAPSEATEALGALVYLLENRAYWRKELGEFVWERSVDHHLDCLRATPEGRALLGEDE